MEEKSILVLFDLHSDCEETKDDGRGLRLGQGSMRIETAHARRSRMALARKVADDVRSLWRSFLTALIAFSPLPRAQ